MKFLYVMRSDGGLVKVGIASNIEKRRQQLQSAGGHPISVLAAHGPFVAAARLEALVHALLDDKRACGEWFSASPEEVAEAVSRGMADFVDLQPPVEQDIPANVSRLAGSLLEPGLRSMDSKGVAEAALGKYAALLDDYDGLADELLSAAELVSEYRDMLKDMTVIAVRAVARAQELEAQLLASRAAIPN